MDELEHVEYKPLGNFVDKPPATLLSARAHAEECIKILPRVPSYEAEMLDQCCHVVQSKLSGDFSALIEQHNLCCKMTFAITLYILEMTVINVTADREDNFYKQFNEMLRARDGKKLKICHGYLYLLMTGLDRLPPYTDPNPISEMTVLYRGIDKEGFERARSLYKYGKLIHWSAFSSASVDIMVAMSFAGADGIVLKITLMEDIQKRRARDIRPFSPYGDQEQEILLLPNFKGCITKGLHLDEDLGQHCIEILEIEPGVAVY
eukprot:SRR837773.7482.p1 GENE.SRR837773.7482~~SRR837773.7482.p1  ORF type:complete len:303 (+),score=117.25 SRR837773.7482:121-909(+)